MIEELYVKTRVWWLVFAVMQIMTKLCPCLCIVAGFLAWMKIMTKLCPCLGVVAGFLAWMKIMTKLCCANIM
ncbi:MAG: hypothetical protein QOE33_3640 [Acidobacteriota bacterium]|nr:hypothetical protein [Acidobacteriota bacterium]